MLASPHGIPAPRGHMVPGIGPVVHRLKQEPLVLLGRGKIGLLQQAREDGQAGFQVNLATRVTGGSQPGAERVNPWQAIAAAELSTGSQSLNGSAGRSRQAPSCARPGAPVSQYGTPSAALLQR